MLRAQWLEPEAVRAKFRRDVEVVRYQRLLTHGRTLASHEPRAGGRQHGCQHENDLLGSIGTALVVPAVLSRPLVLRGKGEHRRGDRGDPAAANPAVGDGHGVGQRLQNSRPGGLRRVVWLGSEPGPDHLKEPRTVRALEAQQRKDQDARW